MTNMLLYKNVRLGCIYVFVNVGGREGSGRGTH